MERRDGDARGHDGARGHDDGRPERPGSSPAPWPPPPGSVPRSRAEIVAEHGTTAERAWTRVRHGMYVPPGVEVTPRVRAFAEVRARPGAVLSGATAAHAWGHPWVCDALVDIVVVDPASGCRADAPDGVTTRRGGLVDKHETLAIGDATVPVAGRLDVTIDCVAALPDHEAIAFLDGAIRAWRIHPELRAWADGGRGRGATRMRRLLDWTDWRAESRLESLLRTLLRRAGLTGWVPQWPVLTRGGMRWIDLGDPMYMIGLEYQGGGHWSDAAHRKRDADRANELRDMGWWILEVTALDVFRDFDALVRAIRERREAVVAERKRDLAWRRQRHIDHADNRARGWRR
ncbi:endonuclease domain-containing protein [uncultured Corynebacterium sp.]|uniref:endonuclease domain-containing protein n=1 Tax=uncultured Corynebacterium sp. TaxID=159447 RepID=UPI0025F6CE42|nr:hypothetical protein [uncultured Corynebacterium sp.]